MNRVFCIKNKNYTTISNVFMRDANLSLKAKGLLALIMTLPNDWDFTIKGIASIVKEGKTAIYSAIDELKTFGYCVVQTIRNERGVIIGNDYTFFETPQQEKPHLDYPHLENPNMDNQPQINKDITNIEDYNIDILNKDITQETKLSKLNLSKKLDFSRIAPQFMPIVEEWLQYKKEKNQPYKQKGLTAFYNRLMELSGGDVDIAKQIISQSMASNYAGIFPLKATTSNNGTTTRNKSLPIGMILQGDRDLVLEESKKDLW